MVHVIFLITFGISFLSTKIKKNNALLIMLSFLILLLFSILRYDFGNDYWNYYKIFNDSKFDINSSHVESLYFYLNKIIPSYNLLLSLFSLLYLIAIYILINSCLELKYAYIAIFIFLFSPSLFLMSLSAVRQVASTAIFIIAILLPIRKKIIHAIIFVLLILFSSLFHKTSLILLPFVMLIFFDKNILKNRFISLIFILMPMIFIVAPNFLNEFMFYIIKNLFDNNLNYLSYIENGYQNSIRSTILNFIIYFYVLSNLHKLTNKEFKIGILYLIGLIFGILSYRFNMLTRIQMFFEIFGIITIPLIIKHNENLNIKTVNGLFNKIIMPCLVFLIIILRYYSFFTNEMWEPFFEYKTWLFK